MSIDSLHQKLFDYLAVEARESENIFSQLALYIYQHEAKETDLYILAKLLPDLETLTKVISFFNGDVIKIPTKEQFKHCYIVAICFFLKETKGWSWTKIKEHLKLSDEDFNTYKIGHRISYIKENLNKDLELILQAFKKKQEEEEKYE